MKLIIDRFEGDKAILKTEDGKSIIWLKNKLPDNCHEGMTLTFTIGDDAQTEEEKRELAKKILNEILDTEN